MATTPPLDFKYQKGFEIPTKHKEAIRQLHQFAKVLISQLKTCYKLENLTICRILSYNGPEQACLRKVGLAQKLTDAKIDKIIKYYANNQEQQIIKYNDVIKELDLPCVAYTLQARLH